MPVLHDGLLVRLAFSPERRKAIRRGTFGLFLEKAGNTMTVVCVLLVLLVWTFTADKNTYTGISALRSLTNGDAAVYYEEAMERHALYVDETIQDVVIEPYSTRPALFDFEDLTTDTDNWLNLAVSDYYGKNSVKLREGSGNTGK